MYLVFLLTAFKVDSPIPATTAECL